MIPRAGTELERLSSSSTTWWSRVFPTAWSIGFGGVTAAIWLDLLGSPPLPDLAKGAMLAAWAVISVVFFKWLGGFQHVWLDGDDLVLGDAQRGVRVSLRDISDVKESRFQKLKTATLVFRRATPLGTSVHFIPEDGWRSWMIPWAPSPVVRELKERLARLEAGGDARVLSR